MARFISALLGMILASVSMSTNALASKSAKPIEIKYFNARGRAETSRILLEIASQKYTDTRYDFDMKAFKSPDFEKAKEGDELVMSLKKLPALVTPEGEVIGQSRSMERYISKKFGLMGSTDVEEAYIDCITEHCRDVNDGAARKGFSAFTKGKSDEEKAAARAEWFDTDLPAFLEKIEGVLEITSTEKGYSVGSKTSYADVVIFAMLRDCSPADLESTTKASEKCLLLNAIASRVESDDKVSKWLKNRPVTMF
mmetsp:Transcript_10461/g.14780  ORF Transcript_10461/g.14780 Transcript_10461/m.14780 type:complete len:254 (-) Transcript_10461:48-809(-)|eukprot:CAMPEP_0184862926 /NCGR_PEP_ID=MMETSP0580-20130426/8153_1 /TAXON_ID=1118495 /ORGANISM="Dactyliosolen fragilissimus" /LENGTH=253 /DNA_ID=CAMNT_0027360945 /DNA_START=68 /DNA_END=829 /DNA_ORIENTATION=-